MTRSSQSHGQWASKQGGTVTEVRDYYPYGGLMPARSYSNDSPRAKEHFTGKERDREFEFLEFDYFGARFYDANIVRWMSVDPLAESTPQISPYAYALCNPMRFIDPNGMTACPPFCGTWENPYPMREYSVYDRPGTADKLNTGIAVTMGVGVAAYAAPQLALFALRNPATTLEAIGVGGRFAAQVMDPNPASVSAATSRILGNIGRAAAEVSATKGMGNIALAEMRVTMGASDGGVAVIGRWMDGRVLPFAEALGDRSVNTFAPSSGAQAQWNMLVEQYGGRVPDAVARLSRLYRENLSWITNMKRNGFTIIDIGEGGAPSQSVFYEMERGIVYRD